MGRFTINGFPFSGNKVSIRNGRVTVDGVSSDQTVEGVVEIRVLDGDVGTLETDASVKCSNVTGSVRAGGSVSCNDVGGDVNAGGSVSCDDVKGNLKAGGSVSCDDVGGSVTAKVVTKS